MKSIMKMAGLALVTAGIAFGAILSADASAQAAAPAAPAAAAPAGDAAAAPAAGGDAAAASSGGGGQSFMDVVLGGSWLDKLIWALIFLTSFATLALIIDAVISIRAKKIMPPELVDAVKAALAEGDLGAAMEACEATPGPLANILMAGFNNISEGYEVVMDAVSSTADMETEKLMQRVNYLNLCGAIAPMLGLMGTVTGMVSAFAGLATTTGAQKAQMLAMSISTALYTTAVGLIISIPAILGYTFVKNNATKIILLMESLTYDLIKVLKGAEVVGSEGAVEEEAE